MLHVEAAIRNKSFLSSGVCAAGKRERLHEAEVEAVCEHAQQPGRSGADE